MSGAGRRRRLAAAAASAFLVALGGCGGGEPQPAPEAPPDATYTVRGLVRQLPGTAGRELVVFHEAIPEFVDRKGERSGMDSMPMPFGVTPDLDLAAIAEGDKVEMTFELRWQDPQPLRVVELVELPADTELRVGAAARSQAAPPPEDADASPIASPGPTPEAAASPVHEHH
jgi:hypothetical protein